MTDQIPSVRLRNKHDKRAKNGHPWIFSNEIDGDVRQLPAGGVVDVLDSKGALVGRGYANPASLIAVRLLSQRRDDIDHPAFWAHKLRSALSYRQRVLPGRVNLRLVHGEGDGLPGLIVDRFGDWLSVQLTTLGTETRKAAIQQALIEVFQPKGAVLRSEGRSRRHEGLEPESGHWFGETPPEHVDFEEDGVIFRVDLLSGLRIGHFYDRTESRRFAGRLCEGLSVLDVYSHGGAWALNALKNGATHALCIDKSEACGAQMAQNAELNGLTDRMEIAVAEGKTALVGLVGESARFGAVILDPPAFARSRKAAGAALRGYRELNALGITLVEPGGLLFTSSSSPHVQEERFLDEIHKAARQAGRRLRLFRRGEQSSDHPVRIEIPETRYLKTYAFQVEMGV